MQTIIGSGGAIGTPLAKALKKYTDGIRLASRNPQQVNGDDILLPIDATDSIQLNQAIAGSDIVYVTIGFPYNRKVWQNTWPPFMHSVIEACEINKAKLVFFDNMYLYDRKALSQMKEDSPINPSSKKGEVRSHIHNMITERVKNGTLNALIARSADFYGPQLKNSALGEMVVKKLQKGKKAMAFGDLNKIHTYTFTTDAAEATALLGNTPDAYNQVWHLPTTKERLTNMQWIELIAKELNTQAKVQVVPKWMVRTLGLFIPIMREFPEMMYQNELDYVFDSTRFEERFGIKAIPPEEGIRKMVDRNISG